MILKELSNQEFKSFTNTFDSYSLYQTLEYACIMNEQNFDSIFIGLIDEKEKIYAATLLLLEKRGNMKYAYAPRGFLIDYQNEPLLECFTRELKKYLNKKNVMAVKLNPYIIRYIHTPQLHTTKKDVEYDMIFNRLKKLGYHHLGYNHFFEALKPRYEAILALDVPYYNLFKRIRKEFRTKIRGAEERGMNVHRGTIQDLPYLYLQTQKKYPRDLKYFEDCYRFFSKKQAIDFFYVKLNTHDYLKTITQKYQKQEVICNQLNQALSRATGKENKKVLNQKMEADQILFRYKQEMIQATQLLRNQPAGIIIASALIIKQRKQVYLIMDGYDTKFKKLNAKHLLIWKLCEKYSKEGYTTFNLGGLTNLDIPNNPYKGLNEFKIGFQPIVYEYIGDLELITNNTLYFMYRNSAPIRNILKR